MHRLKVNDKLDYNIERNTDHLTVNSERVHADISQIDPSRYHIINDLRSYNVEVLSFDRAAKTAAIKVNGTVYTVTAKDQFDLLLDQLGMSALNAAKVSEIKAPMPGMVLKLFVKEGMEVKKGDNLFILEAMKMENIIKSPADVTVKAVRIRPGDKVEKGQVLLMF
jgi:biotin carboxyl carrier protein